jgi:(p)ppGpp synthase/HD superfamily hydrolase
MRDIASLVAAADINMTSLNVTTTKNTASIRATLEISDIAQLSNVLTKIERLPNVVEARRQAG